MYTHNFEIDFDGVNIQGEIVFNHGTEPSFKTISSEELTIKQHRKVQDLLEALVVFYKDAGDVDKIEIIKKVP